MTDSIDVFHYLRDQESLTRPESLRSFLEKLAAQNFYLASEWRKEVDAADPANPFVPGVSPSLWQKVEQFLQGQQDELSIYVFSTTKEETLRRVDYRLELYPKETLLRAVMYNIFPDSQPYRHFLKLLEFLYNTWHPIYGYQDDGVRPVTTLEEARAGHITWLYDINLWGPELVDKLGREQVLKTPAWRLTSFDDGGVLIVPQLFYSDGQKEEYAFTGDEAAAYLGLRSEPLDDERD